MAICPSAPSRFICTHRNTYNELYKFRPFSIYLHQFIPKFLLLYVVICIKILKLFFLNVTFGKSVSDSSL